MTVIAIIGQGAMARAHARAWSEIGLGSSIRYVCTPGAPVPLEDAPEARFVTELAAVLADPLVDTISICTPTPTHAEIAIRCLEAGRNVLLEKPIALTLADAEAIMRAAAASSGVFMVAHVVRFFDGYLALRERVEAGALGTVLQVRAERLSASPGPSSWWHDESKSGGAIVDFAIHDFDQLNLFLGRPVAVHAARVGENGPITTAVDYASGARGEVVAFMGMPARFPFASSLEVLGSDGIGDYRFTGSPTGEVVSNGNDCFRVVTDSLQNHRVDLGNPYARQAQYFLDCVQGGVQPELCPTDAAVAALALALAARDSLLGGRPVRVS